MEQDESDVLAKAAQLAALEKRIGLKLDMAEYIEPDEYDGEEIDEANTLALAYAGRISNALLAKHSALEASRARITELESLLAEAREVVKPFKEYREWARLHSWPVTIAEDPCTPVWGNVDYDRGVSCEVTVGDFDRAAALSTKLEAPQ